MPVTFAGRGPLLISAAQQGPATPTLIQHVASSANPVGVGPGGTKDNFKIPLPNSVGAGNCIILGITYPTGHTATVTDNNSNSWPGSPTVTADSGTCVAAIFVLPNANSGQTTINVAFGSDTIPFQYNVSEFNNIATVSPANGSHGTAGTTGPSLSCGSFTPTTNNDANGGNLMWAYFPLATTFAAHNPTSWSAGGSFKLLNTDIAWIDNDGFPHASQYFVATNLGNSTSINPSITATGDSGDTFNCVAVALKAANAGTAIPAGIHINAIHHQTADKRAAATTWPIQIPFTGNLRCLQVNFNISVTGVTDSDGNTWTVIQPNTGANASCFIAYMVNTSASPAGGTTVTVAFTSTTNGCSCRVWDIQGALASPVGATAGAGGDASAMSSISNAPSITPNSTNSLILVHVGMGQGPVFSATSPSGAVFDACTYGGELDTDLMENADGLCHYRNSSTAQKNFNWNITNIPGMGTNNFGAAAIEFLSS